MLIFKYTREAKAELAAEALSSSKKHRRCFCWSCRTSKVARPVEAANEYEGHEQGCHCCRMLLTQCLREPLHRVGVDVDLHNLFMPAPPLSCATCGRTQEQAAEDMKSGDVVNCSGLEEECPYETALAVVYQMAP